MWIAFAGPVAKVPHAPLRLAVLILALAGIALPLRALDINPSRDNEPNTSNDNGGRFSIFSGDPARIQKANSIDFKDFVGSVTLDPAQTSLSAHQGDAAELNSVKITFNVKNSGKRTYTLSFPNTERYDLTIKNPAGQLVYQWSLDKKFVDDVGVVMINPTDQIGYSEIVSLSTLYAPLEPGVYTIEMHLANYPEITGKASLTVSP